MSAVTDAYARLSPRERLLVLLAAALLGVLILWFAVFGPILAARDAAKASYAEAAQTYALVQRAAATPRTETPGSAEPLRSVLSQTAAQAGLTIDRYDIQENAIDLTVASTAADTLYSWLGELSRRHGIVVREGTVREVGEGGEITARLTLVRQG
ncbi:type II secretion system protein GspM [Parvularcula oceani]|uniref:type II secretion system protein GspM n=1 Tax=Parvularcula oceani TaxID=1247963 RepID=UPI0004E18961|nr:type II secretion system protein GspM [Parvularcula oceani]